jgi:hypothetical protein
MEGAGKPFMTALSFGALICGKALSKIVVSSDPALI